LKKQSINWIFLIIVLLAMSMSVSCDRGESKSSGDKLRPYTTAGTKAASNIAYPSYVNSEVLDGYEFAIARPEVLKFMPCYCGCGLTQKHASNLECYILGVDNNGGVVFTDHATFCDICLEIARDARDLLKKGKSLSEIRSYVDRVHGEKGPKTDTPLPPQ
jgi:hypothetical protein